MNLENRLFYRFLNFIYIIFLFLILVLGLLGLWASNGADLIIVLVFWTLAFLILTLLREGIIYVAYGHENCFKWLPKVRSILNKSYSEPNEKIIWSEKPGCFENNLKIKFNNPIFPLNKRTITQNDITKAIEKDEKDTSHIKKELDLIIKESAFLEDQILTMEQFNKLRIKIEKLINEVYGAGGINLDILPFLFDARALLVKSICGVYAESPAVLEALKVAQDSYNKESEKFHNVFVQQYLRSDTPVKPDDVVEILLSESIDNFKAFYHIIYEQDKNLIEKLKIEALAIICSLPSPYQVIRDLGLKLKLLGIDV